MSAAIEAPDFSSPGFKADPFPFYARLRAEAPVYRTRLTFWLEAWLVTRYEDVLLVLKDPRFSNDFWPKIRYLTLPAFRPLARHLLNADPPDHTRLRTLVGKAFTARVVERLRERVQRVCDELLDAAAARGHIELVGEFALALPLTIIGDLLGIPPQERRPFGAWTKRLAAATSGAALDLLLAQPAMWQGMRHLRSLVARRRAEPQDDLVTALVQAEEAGDKLSEDELIGMIAFLIVAGYETTMGLIAGGALALLRNPGQRERLQQDPGLAPLAIEELLRYTSPIDFATFRLAKEDVVLREVTIPKGGTVLAALASANHDETQFREPETLDITRDPNRHLAFGAGSHFCVGAPLARLEGQLALPTLFRRFPEIRLAARAEAPRWRRGLLFRALAELPLVLGRSS